MGHLATTERVSYDDYHAWVLQQIELLKAGRFVQLDVPHLIGELGDLSYMPKREIESRLTILLQHLLKWHFQPDRRSNSWRAAILEQRYRISRELTASPSPRRHPAEVLAEECRVARLRAADETGLSLQTFPATCPYSAAQALDVAFWPGGGADVED